MSEIEMMLEQMTFNRQRTLGTLDRVADHSEANTIMGWRPGTGRAHLAWQFMHIGITEELFATERLRGTETKYADLAPRFKGGSTPDDDIPSTDLIRTVLEDSRERLADYFRSLSVDDLDTVPEALAERGWTLRQTMRVLSWHECHHQGQAHITMNLWEATAK